MCFFLCFSDLPALQARKMHVPLLISKNVFLLHKTDKFWAMPKKTSSSQKDHSSPTEVSRNKTDNVIAISGARVHNLKNISASIPRDTMSVITGLSGSGKSSLAFDVIYAESNRRYMESLSTHARMITGSLNRPDVDKISGLSPAIAIDQRSIGRSSRSTVGTMTEIYDYLRILFATVGVPHCPETGRPLYRKSARDIVDSLSQTPDDTDITILSPVAIGAEQSMQDVLKHIVSDGYARVRFHGKMMPVAKAQMIASDDVRVAVEIVVDHFTFDANDPDSERMADSVETAMKLSGGSVVIVVGVEESRYTKDYYCQESGFRLSDVTPRHFSFNNPDGACHECDGIGRKNEIDPELIIPNKTLSLSEGAIHLWSKAVSAEGKVDQNMEQLIALGARYKFSLDVPVKKLTKIHLALVLYGAPEEIRGTKKFPQFPGVIPTLEKKYREARSEHMRSELEKHMTTRICPSCNGKRLSKAYLAVTIGDESIDDFVQLPLSSFCEKIQMLADADFFTVKQKISFNHFLKKYNIDRKRLSMLVWVT